MSCSQQPPARQRGMSLLSALVILSVAVFFVLIGVKMAPVYMENYAIREVLEAVARDRDSRSLSSRRLKDNILRRMSINGVYNFPKEKIKIKNTHKGRHVALDYEVRKPIIGNVSIVMTFAESADIPSND